MNEEYINHIIGGIVAGATRVVLDKILGQSGDLKRKSKPKKKKIKKKESQEDT